MEHSPVRRRLTAILAADAVGYSARMGENEERTHRTLTGHRQVIAGLIAAHDGRLVGTAGDGVLAEFGSSVEAVRCAVEIQEALATRNDLLPADARLQFRIGVNLGDVIVEGDDILGDGVNVAARLEGIAEPGGICVASSVFDQISGKLNLGFEDIGNQSLKNIARPVRAYRLARTSGVAAAGRGRGTQGIPTGLIVGGVAILLAVAAAVYVFTRVRQEPSAQPAVAARPDDQATLQLQIAEARRATAEAELARVRAEAAERPRAEAARRTESVPASRSEATSDTKGAIPASSRGSAPPARTLESTTPQPAAVYRSGSAELRCQPTASESEVTLTAPVRVEAGEFVIASDSSGRRGSFHLRGRLGPTGGLVLRGIFVGRGRGRVAVQFHGRLVEGHGTLAMSDRPCTLSLELTPRTSS